MGQGLGRNSPVQLSLGRENYEALIDRHGQWIRWRIANKCSCVNRQTFQPDIHCKNCGGRGFTYSYQRKQIFQCVVMNKDDSHILELDDFYINDSLIKVYDYNGNVLEADKMDTFIMCHQKLEKGVYYNVVVERDNLESINSVELVKSNGKYFEVPGLENKKSNIEGVYYSSPSDVVSVGSIVDAEGNEFQVDELRLNKILLKSKFDEDGNEIVPVEPLSANEIKFIRPFIFALLNQNLSKGDLQALTEANGDAICTYPYSCDVANDDILTVLAGTVTNKDIVCRTKDKVDKLPAYFVESIVSVIGKDGINYTEGTDYILTGTNNIRWLCDDAPEFGDGYSVTYKVFPTYTVLRDIPQLRTSENQRFPKKAVVKYMANYSEQKKVNRQ